jgi:hypothetical protein
MRCLVMTRIATASDGILSYFTCADADDLFQIGDENFAVPDSASLGGADDRVDDVRDIPFGDNYFDSYFGNEIDGIFCASVRFFVAVLPPETLDFRNGHARDAIGGQLVFHIIQPVVTNNGFDSFHDPSPYVLSISVTGRR